MRVSFRSPLAIAATTLFLLVAAPTPHGMAAQDPQQFVGQIGQQAIQSLGPQVAPAQRAAHFRQLFSADFDVPGIGKFVLGRYWTVGTSSGTAAAISGLFQEYIARTYSDPACRIRRTSRSGSPAPAERCRGRRQQRGHPSSQGSRIGWTGTSATTALAITRSGRLCRRRQHEGDAPRRIRRNYPEQWRASRRRLRGIAPEAGGHSVDLRSHRKLPLPLPACVGRGRR